MNRDKITDRRTHPFFMTENRLIDEGHIARMGLASYAVYSCLCRHANTEHQCFPSYGKLQEETGSARETIWKALSRLIALGYIRKLTLKRKQANIYEIMDLPTYSKDSDGIEEHPSSSEIEPVRKSNQFENRTTTSSEIEPPLVRKSNSKNTNEKKTKEKNTKGGDARARNFSSESFSFPISPWEESASDENEKGSAVVPIAENREPFESPDEEDRFYAYAFEELSKDSKRKREQIENDAKWMVLRLKRSQSDPRDRLYLSNFKQGLTRVSKLEVTEQDQAIYDYLMRRYENETRKH